MGLVVAGIHFDGAAEHSLRRAQVVLFEVRFAKENVGTAVVRVEPNGAFEGRDGGVPVFAAGVGVAQFVVGHREIGIDGDFLAHLLHALVEIVPENRHDTDQIVRLWDFRIELEGAVELLRGEFFEFLADQELGGQQVGSRGFSGDFEHRGEGCTSLHRIALLDVAIAKHIKDFIDADTVVHGLLQPGGGLGQAGQQVVALTEDHGGLAVFRTAGLLSRYGAAEHFDGLRELPLLVERHARGMIVREHCERRKQYRRRPKHALSIMSFSFMFHRAVMLAACLLVPVVDAQSVAELRSQAAALKAKGDAAGALELTEKAAEADPKSGELEDEVGFLLAVLKRGPEAKPHFERAIELEPKLASAYFHLGVLYWLEKDPNHSIPLLQSAVALAPAVADYHLKLGVSFYEVSHYEESVKELKIATTLEPRNAAAWNSLGLSLQQTGPKTECRDAFAQAVVLNPNDLNARNSYGFMLVQFRQPEQAMAQFHKVLEMDPRNTGAMVNIGFTYLQTGEYKKAEDQFRAAIRIDPNSAVTHYDLGLALKQQDQLEEAKIEFQAAIRIDNDLPEAHYTLGMTVWQLGDSDETAKQMRAAVAQRPDYGQAHYLLGSALKQKGELDAALEALREAARLLPQDPGPFNMIGQILRTKGDIEGSKQAFAEAAAIKKKKEAEQAETLREGHKK